MGELSDRQASILDFVSSHCASYGYPPTVREIGLAVGLASPSTVHGHLAKLEALGYIRRHPTKPRAMLVHDRGRGQSGAGAGAPRSAALPLVGAVAAGLPRLATEDVEDWVPVPFRGDFVLRVTGDSMIDAGILDGDMVVVRRQEAADDGEIVVALLEDGEATVKRLRRSDGRVLLHAENPAYAPILATELRILGKVVGLLRGIS
jgi:repressor LexA